MAQAYPLFDEHGVLMIVKKELPKSLYNELVITLSELENAEYHKTGKFPHAQLHPLKGIKSSITVYECYIHKTTGWRFQVVRRNGRIELLHFTKNNEHDRVAKIVQSSMNSFNIK